MCKKKILFIMPALPGGGAEKVLVDILKRLDRSKFEISLLLTYCEGVYVEQIPHDIELIYIHKKSTLNHERLLRYLHIFGLYNRYVDIYYKRRIRKLLAERHFDTIVSFMEGEAVRLHSYIFDKADKNISWVHIDLLTKHWSESFFRNIDHEKNIYEAMDNVVFVSEEAKTKFIELFNHKKDNIFVIYNLIPKDEIISKANNEIISKRKFTIVLVGRLNSQKRFDKAIDVAELLHKDGVDFDMWILGEGELRSELENRISQKGLDGIVHLIGFKNPPYPYLDVADIYLSTSDSEGYPLTMCEALCIGLPIVSTKTSGPNEILENSKYGLLVDFDTESIYKGVSKLIENKALLSEYRKKALKRSEMFDPNATIRIIEGVISH